MQDMREVFAKKVFCKNINHIYKDSYFKEIFYYYFIMKSDKHLLHICNYTKSLSSKNELFELNNINHTECKACCTTFQYIIYIPGKC